MYSDPPPYRNGTSHPLLKLSDPEKAILINHAKELGEVKGVVQQHDKRLDRLEGSNRRRITLSDMAPWAYGVMIMVAVMAGKISAHEGLKLFHP